MLSPPDAVVKGNRFMDSREIESAILLIHCPDRKGLVASVTEFLFRAGGNILDLAQHVDAPDSMFFMRVEWDLADFAISREEIGRRFDDEVGGRFDMTWKLFFSDEVPRMAVFVSRLPHCLYDILARCESGEWPVDLPLVVSNHEDLRPVAEHFDVDYHHVPVTTEAKVEAEEKQLALLEEYDIDFIVLARYMQILTEDFVDRYPERILNIHHSFLPAFPGARPYERAHERGVKIIGATSHYVIPELDAGPIIEQDVVKVGHDHTVEDLVRKGRDLEKVVLARAVWSHLRRKILVYRNRTVIFN